MKIVLHHDYDKVGHKNSIICGKSNVDQAEKMFLGSARSDMITTILQFPICDFKLFPVSGSSQILITARLINHTVSQSLYLSRPAFSKKCFSCPQDMTLCSCIAFFGTRRLSDSCYDQLWTPKMRNGVPTGTKEGLDVVVQRKIDAPTGIQIA
jgi:hypothetical protein